MGLESASQISELVPTNPLGSDEQKHGDDHIRLIKSVLKSTFHNCNGPINATQADLNMVTGFGSPQAVALAANASNYSGVARATKFAGMVFLSGYLQQDANPCGSTTLFCTLPTGYRPLADVYTLASIVDFASALTWQSLPIKIATDGQVTLVGMATYIGSSTGPVVVSLGTISFYFASYN